MRKTDTIIIGAGQAGLAMSHCLARLGIDHVVLEQGRIAERWRSQRWDSLRLLTPSWMSQFPGWSYQGPDPDGFMTAREYVAYLEQYAAASAAPVMAEVTVESVWPTPAGYAVETDAGIWRARCVVIATGHCDVPIIPAMAKALPGSIEQFTPSTYRNPAQLPEGGVLVVGASASGAQIAEEVQRSGRQVTLAVGCHTRLPRQYRGRDIMWWLDRFYKESTNTETEPELRAARAQPSMQLVGRPDRTDLDLCTLHEVGVRIAGRASGISEGVVYLQDDLAKSAAGSHARMERLLARLDVLADAAGAPREPAPAAFVPEAPAESLHLARSGVQSVVWATGFRRNYSWLNVPVLDAAGELVHARGVTPAPGLFVTGLRFQSRRDASFISAIASEAPELAAAVLDHLNQPAHAAA